MNDKQRAVIRVREALRDLLTAIHSEGEEVPPQMLKVLQVVYGQAARRYKVTSPVLRLVERGEGKATA